MRADCDASLARGQDRGGHAARISGVKSAGDVGGADQPEQLALARLAFAEVRVQVDGMFHAGRRARPIRNRCRSFSRSAKSAVASAAVTS